MCFFSTLYCYTVFLTCKNRLPHDLHCVGGDVKHSSINQSISPKCRSTM